MGNASLRSMLYWFSGMPAWGQLIPPQEIPLGKSIYTAIGWVNNLTQAQQGHVELVVTKPDGTPLALSATLNQDAWADPGSGWFVQFEPLLLNQGGAWGALVTLSTEVESATPPRTGITSFSVVLEYSGSPAAIDFYRCEAWDGTQWVPSAEGATLPLSPQTFTGIPQPCKLRFYFYSASTIKPRDGQESGWLNIPEGYTLWWNPWHEAPATMMLRTMMSRRAALRVWRGGLFGIHPRRR